jgi:DNA-binding FadR family transcriptional regulator
MTDAIPRRKLYQEVLDRLMARIRSGEIPAGSNLPSERELMDEFRVGRPAIREALQAMDRSGILEIVHGERARVVVPTPERLVSQIAAGTMHLLRSQPGSLEHLKQVRLFVECGTARMAAEKATGEQVAKLRLLIEQQRSAIHNIQGFIEKDLAFHKEIATISGNPIFPVIVEAIFLWAREYYQSLVRAPGAENLTLSEHEKIVDAINARDPSAAADAMHVHLSRANELYQQLIRRT